MHSQEALQIENGQQNEKSPNRTSVKKLRQTSLGGCHDEAVATRRKWKNDAGCRMQDGSRQSKKTFLSKFAQVLVAPATASNSRLLLQ